MANEFILPSDLPEEPAAPAKVTVRPADARPAFVLPSEEEEKAAEPKRKNTTILDYPEIYTEKRHEAQNQIGEGVKQLTTPTEGGAGAKAWETVKGVGNVGLGALGYASSPIDAAYDTVIGEPLEQLTHGYVPKRFSSFAAQLATPGLGLRQLFKPLTPVTKVKPPREGKLADEARLFTKEGQETQAGLALKEAAKIGEETPAQVRAKLANEEEIIPGSPATTFQAAPNRGLGQLERGVGATSEGQAALQGVREQQGIARTGALEKDILKSGNPEEVANDLRARMKAEDAAAEAAEKAAVARAEANTQTATARAEAADRAAGGTGFTPDISGQVFQRELTEANTASRNAASRLWDDIDPQGRLSVDASPVMNAEFRARSNMTLADAEGVTDAERAIQRVINSYGPITPFREMRSLRSLISTSMREERRRVGESPAWGRMAELRRAVEDSVAAPFERGVPAGPQQAAMSADAADRLAAATAATKERAATFKVEPIQGIIRPGQGGELRATPSTVPGKIIPTGPKGYDTVNAYLRATGGRGLQDVSEALVADMRAYATDVNGNLDPGRVMGWARGKQHALRAVSELDGGALARRLEEVQTSGFGVKAATKEQARTIKEAAAERAAVSKKGNEGIFGDLMGVRDKEDISKLLGSVFGSKTAVNDAREIMSRLTTPEAQDGARRAVADWITSRLVSNTSAGLSDVNILRADQFQTFIKNNGAVLKEFGFTDQQINTMRAISADMSRSKKSIDATKLPGGSNTAQDLYAMKRFGLKSDSGSSLLNTAGAIAGWLEAGKLGAVAGFFTTKIASKFRKDGIKSVQDLIVEAMVDPAVAHKLLGKTLPQEKIAFGRTLGKFGARAARTSIITGGPHPDQSAPAGYASGGAVRPLGREGIKARNKARAAAARERSSLARGAAQAKRKVGYADGGEVEDRWASLPSSRNVEDRRDEAPLSMGQLVAGNQAFMGHYPSPYTRAPRKKAAAQGLADGGRINDDSSKFDTDLGDDEAGFQTWKTQNAPNDSGSDYDLRGAYKAGVTPDPETGHWPDTYKKPNHPTFSNQSQYATGENAARAGSWEGDTYIPPDQAGGFEAAAARTRRRAPVREPDPISLAVSQGKRGTSLGEFAKGSASGMLDLVTTPGRAYRGEATPEEIENFGPAMALNMLGANAPLAITRPGLGIFGGRGAKTANLPKLAEAEQMLKEGVPHETIRNRTGWEFGADGKPRFEISDAEARIKPEHPNEFIHEPGAASRPSGFRPLGRLEEAMEHPAAYEAYPWLKDVKTRLDVNPKNVPGASYAPPTKYSLPGSHGDIEVRAPTYERGGVGDLFGEQKYSDAGARDLMLHEMQHAIQNAEKFAPGANPRDLPLSKDEVTTLTRNMAKRDGVDYDGASPTDKAQMERVVRHRIYKMHAGETEARNVQTRADDTLRQRPSWATEDVPRETQIIDKKRKLKPGEKPFNDAKVYKLERDPGTEAPPSKPGLMRSEFDRPLFDYSRMAEVPNVPQFDLPRINPARGVPEHMQRLGKPENVKRVNKIVDMGLQHGGREWYNTMPLRERYVGELGAARGPEAWDSYMKYVGATSPRTPVPTNIGVASHYDMLAAQGRPFPEPVWQPKSKTWSLPEGQLPEGYGSLAQATNAHNAQIIRESGGWPSWTHFDKPKPPSFTSNLLGNYQPLTSDVHNVSMLNMRRPDTPSGAPGERLIMPPHQYYSHVEKLQQGEAAKKGIAPAQYQAAGWIPWAAGYREVGRHGEVTGGSPKKLASYSEPFVKTVEDRIKKKARQLGWSPEQTLRAFLRKEIAIAGVPAAAIPFLQSLQIDQEE